MFAKPQKEHEWLNQFVGNWKVSHDCEMPDGTTSKTEGTMACRMLGGMWLICESTGESPEGEPWSSIMAVGYDPVKERYVGSFVGSMMANVWSYEGEMDTAGNRLPLNTVGPKFDGSGTCNYRDTFEPVDADKWFFGSELQNEDGTWTKFMHGVHTRI